VRLVSVSENLEDSVSGRLVENIKAAIAEFYSANLAEEVKKAMRQRVRQGGWPHQPPRGYSVARSEGGRRIELDTEQASIIRRAFELCLSGYSGLPRLRLHLALAGLRSKSGRPVSNGYLGRLLRNPFYCGRVRWDGERHRGIHTALVTAEVFERVLAVLRDRARCISRSPVRYPWGVSLNALSANLS
jgi:site-specific DNA recombinase